jgi:hypothetical protein
MNIRLNGMRLRCVALIGVLVLSDTAVYSQTRCPADSRMEDLATRFIIHGGTIKMPIGAFLLVRKKTDIGAIRLISIDPTSTEWLGKSVYESYFQSNASGSFSSGNVVTKTGELNLQESKGLGRGVYIYKPGPYRASIGKWSFSFFGPSLMGMSDHSSWTGDFGDHGFEFAPTSACNLSEVNVHDNRLRWFRYDRNANVILTLSELAK